jgi:hypothetical protein
MRMVNKWTLLLIALLVSTELTSQASENTWNFDAETPDGNPEGFTGVLGEWKVVADPGAPSGPSVLAQLAKNSGSTFNLILVDGTNNKNVDITVKMKAVAGKEDQGGGLVWRLRDPSNYYVARYNPLEDNYRVYKVDKGRRSELQSAVIKHSDGWHTLRVTMEGDHIQCYYDGGKFLDVKDTTLQEAGKIGLWTKADAQSHFDDLTMDSKKTESP